MPQFISTPPATKTECNAALQALGDAIYAIGGKWKLRIILTLSEGHSRFNEIQRNIEGISARVLSNELKDMEMNGFISRTVHPGSPAIVEYKLTEYSGTLDNVVRSLIEWGTMHRTNIKNGMRETAPLSS